MTIRDQVNNEYFEWMCNTVDADRFPKENSYNKLLMHLHSVEFTWSIPRDSNRAENGIAMRFNYSYNHAGYEDAERYLTGPCSVLEMMVALALQCEKTLMDDPAYGDRTGQWFWGMIKSLGLGSMTDSRFDRGFVDDVIYRFLNREYEPNGKGGLFTIKNCEEDLREVEIFYQLCWYLDTIV